ncbi:MAG TPA: hypothetical protein VG796_06960 [Verrucomicrobiales bacterium]|nr:hypothetical protein [Verrucomicrobiales bacterium]
MTGIKTPERSIAADACPNTSIDVPGLMYLLSESARTLARKGFKAGPPQPGDKGCSLTITSKAFGLEARIGFRQSSEKAGAEWSHVIVSDHTGMVSESGTVATSREASEQLQAFISVISTLASFKSDV